VSKPTQVGFTHPAFGIAVDPGPTLHGVDPGTQTAHQSDQRAIYLSMPVENSPDVPE
jgi:hypothetical protein